MSELTLKRASIEDCRFVFETNNEPSVRANAITPADIVWEDHVLWFADKLASPKTVLWIVIHSREPVGVLRFDLDEPTAGAATISIAISLGARDRGIGTKAIAAGTSAILKRQDVNKVVAHIRPNNLASLRAFTKAGYAEIVRQSVDNTPLLQVECE